MKKEDLRNRIIPTTIENTIGNEKFNTTDLIYLDSYNEQFDGQKTDGDRRMPATDYAQMTYAYIDSHYTTRFGVPTTWVWLRSAPFEFNVDYIDTDGGRE